MKFEKVYYKVVFKSVSKKGISEIRKSAIVGSGLEYFKDINTTSLEGFGPLCVFRDFSLALNFFYSNYLQTKYNQEKISKGYWEIWECNIEKSKLTFPWTPWTVCPRQNLPAGTVLANSVTLTKLRFDGDTYD